MPAKKTATKNRGAKKNVKLDATVHHHAKVEAAKRATDLEDFVEDALRQYMGMKKRGA